MRSTARTARADYTGLRLTPFDAGLQSFPWQPNCPANHKLARDDLARRRALRRCDQAGPIEAACKTVIGKRMKNGGMRWGGDGADELCHLRALFSSGEDQWDAYWHQAPAEQVISP